MVGHSQVQKQVLRLFKDFLRSAEARASSQAGDGAAGGLKELIRREFKKNSSLYDRKDTMQVDRLLRTGRRRLETLKDPRVSGFGRFTD